MTGGYKIHLLRVNLSEQTISEEELGGQLIQDYIGGRGLGIKLLYDELKPGTDPLGEENRLIFLTGPLAGTNAQSFSRWLVVYKSPLTGTYFRSSVGGFLASELKRSGFDIVIIEGCSEKPVYLWINDGRYELRDAQYLWGLECDDTHTLIREELANPRIRIACIGPAGENGVKYAGIFSDRRAAGRGGGGTVMGAKKLKAIAVRGTGKVEVANPEIFKSHVKEQISAYKDSPTLTFFSEHGTHGANLTNLLGACPTRNFREGILTDWKNLSQEEYGKVRVRHTTCSSCMIHCGMIGKMDKGRYKGAWSEGPEYETIWSFSAPIGAADLGLTIAADKLCDDLGLDTISTGVAIGFAYELYEREIISSRDTEGLELIYGNTKPVMELIKQIAHRRGFGALLADGVRKASRTFSQGAERYAMHVKGLEMPGYDPRCLKAQGLNLITSSCGANHNTGWVQQEIFGPPDVRFNINGKGELTKQTQDLQAFWETGIACSFPLHAGGMDEEIFSKLMQACTGIHDFGDIDYLWLVGERIYNLERMFNVREGFSREEDVFPDRFKMEPLPSGPGEGQIFEEKLLLEQYYKARGWDTKTGIPNSEKLRDLGLHLNFEKT